MRNRKIILERILGMIDQIRVLQRRDEYDPELLDLQYGINSYCWVLEIEGLRALCNLDALESRIAWYERREIE